MGLDKQTSARLARFAVAFREARERNVNESDTVMHLVKLFEDVLGYDSLKGKIWKELAIKDRYCDVAFKVEGEGIAHDLVFEANLLDGMEKDHEGLWAKSSILARDAMTRDELGACWAQRRVLSAASVGG